MPDSGSAGAGGFWHQPSSPGPAEAEAFVPRTGHEGAGDSESLATTHRWLCARTSLLGLRAVGEHGRTMDAAHAKHRARNPGRMRCLGRRGASSHGQRGRTPMGDQESVTCEVSQQAQNGQGHKMVECVEQQMEALPTRRTHLPQQREQIERLRTHLRRMANEAPTDEGRSEIWEMATQTYGEPELQVLKDVHWKALTVLDKLHKRDRRAREKAIAEYAREASKGAAGLFHRLTRVWHVHVEELQTADRPWEIPNDDDMAVLRQLEVDGPSGVDTDLLKDVERTLTWLAQFQTLIYFLVPKIPTRERPIELMPSIVRVWERMRKPILDQ